MRKVCYLYNQDFTRFSLSCDHPMKPMRLQMVHSLINNYGLTSHLNMFYSKQATPEELCLFHHPEYVKYLQTWVSPRVANIINCCESGMDEQRDRFIEDVKLGEIFKINQSFDCPGFEGLFNYCQLTAGSSIDAAHLILAGEGDIAINWMGGFHHARKTQASGFCYINDIVICIIELLKVYPRVLYLDIDVHHGDGVEEAFNHTNRVMTVSFHQFSKDFFPETGQLSSVGEGAGKYYTVNVPLNPGIDNDSYVLLFKRVMQRVMDTFRPDVAVIQCGADSLSKDTLGQLHLSVSGHGECLRFMKSFNIPLVLLGGGGYTIQNVSRCWAYETGLMMGHEIDNNIPVRDDFAYFYAADNFKIHFEVNKAKNENNAEYMANLERTITENLRYTNRPSVPFHTPPTFYDLVDEEEEDSSRMVPERSSSQLRSERSRMSEEQRERFFSK